MNWIIILINVILGVLIGTILGLIPNLHLNSIAILLIIFGLFNIFNNIYLFLAFAITHLIISFLPLVLIGIPNTQNITHLFLLQKFSLKGNAYQVLVLSTIGFLLGSIFTLILFPIFYKLFDILSKFNFLIVVAILITLFYFIFDEDSFIQRLIVFSIIILSGVLGIFTLKFNYFNLKQPLFVCIFGLFAAPLLLESLFMKTKLPIQNTSVDNLKINYKESIITSILGVVSSLFIILIPSFSSTQASIIVSKLKPQITLNQKVILYSIISISSLLFSFFLAINFNKSRLGFISILLEQSIITNNIDWITFCFVVIICVSISILILLSISKSIINYFNKIDIQIINLIIISLSIIFIIFISLNDFFVFILSVCIGFLPIMYSKNRYLLLAYIMLPTLLYYL